MNPRGKPPPRERVVEIVAHQMARRFGDPRRFAELYDLGVVPFAEARLAWDGRGQFDPFAMERVRWGILDELRAQRREAKHMAAFAAELSAEQHGRSRDEVLARSANPQHDTEVTIDEVVDGGGANYNLDVEAGELVELDARRIALRRAVTELSPPLDEVMDRLFYQGQSFSQTGKAMGLVKSAVFELHAKAMKELRRFFGTEGEVAQAPPPPA